MSQSLPPGAQPPPQVGTIARSTPLPAAPSGRQVKDIILEQVRFMLDQMFPNHVTFPNALVGISVDAAWQSIQVQQKSLKLESDISGQVSVEDQEAITQGEKQIASGEGSAREEINLNPKGKRMQPKGAGKLPGQPIERQSATSVPEGLAQGAQSEGRTLVGARKDIGGVPSGAQRQKDSTVSRIPMKGEEQ